MLTSSLDGAPLDEEGQKCTRRITSKLMIAQYYSVEKKTGFMFTLILLLDTFDVTRACEWSSAIFCEAELRHSISLFMEDGPSRLLLWNIGAVLGGSTSVCQILQLQKTGAVFGNELNHRPLNTWTGHRKSGKITTALKVKHCHSTPRAPTTMRFTPFDSPIH